MDFYAKICYYFSIMIEDIKKGIISGILISVGGTVYLSCAAQGIGFVGALLFSLGLFAICEYGFNLYTGKVGYIGYRLTDGKYIGFVFLVLICNLIATFLLGIVMGKYFPQVREMALKSYTAKMQGTPLKWIVSSIFCGMLMFLAVDTWKRGTKLGVFLCVPTFIMCGFDHSIANSFYNGAALNDSTFTSQNAIFIVIVILGNALGGMLLPFLTRSWKKEEN